MPAATPNITLTATLEDLAGAAAGTTADAAKLRIALCGFGPVLPRIVGTSMLARIGPLTLYSTGAIISTPLWGNDQITPAGTYYSIEILDGEDNVVQCGAYQFIGSATIDLSNATQLVPPYGFILPALKMAACSGAVPGSSYTAPGVVVAVFVNGICQRPVTDYAAPAQVITLTYLTEVGDTVHALYIQQP